MKKRAPHKEIVKAEPLNETLTVETLVEVVNEPSEPIVKEPEKPIVKVAEESRKVRVFWHKRCTNEKKTTLTTLLPSETLTLTDGTVTIEEKIIPVYSLKRGKRIYYLIDVIPNDIVKATLAKEKRDTLKENERLAKESSAK